MTAPLLSNDPHQEHVLRKVKGKKRESFTRILSKFYNKDNEKDCQTVINTAVNRFGIDPTATDINGILDPANPNRTELLKNSENATLTGFLQEFAEQQQQQQPVPPVAKAAVVSEAPASKLPVISPISGNIKTNLHVIDDTMNMSTYQQVCNSTRVPGDQDLSDQFWKSALKETSANEESIRQERGTIHETTMMDMDLDSSGSNDKISKQSAVASVTNQTEADAVAEKQKEENEFLALLKGDAEDPSEMATDTFEFSFQLPQTNAPTAAETAQMTQGLTSILADDKANTVPSPVPDAILTEQQHTAGLTMEFATDNVEDGADPLMQQLLGVEESTSQKPADFAEATTMDFSEVVGELKSAEVTSVPSMEVTSGMTLTPDGNTASEEDVSMVITEQTDANETLKNTSVEKCLRVLATNTSNQGDFVSQHKQHEKSGGYSLVLPMEEITFEKTAVDTLPQPTATAMTGFTDLFAGGLSGNESNDLPGNDASFNSTLKGAGDESDSISSLLKDSPDSSVIDRSGLSTALSPLPDIKVSVYEITQNLDTQEMVTREEGSQESTPYAPTKPFLGKSASMIIDEEMEELSEAQSAVEGGGTTAAEMNVAEESVNNLTAADKSASKDISLKELSPAEKTVTDVHKPEVAPIETEVSAQSPPKSEAAVVESQSKNLPKVSHQSPAPKRPYDFTLLDSDPVVEQQLKFAKQLGVSSTASALRTSTAFPSSVLAPISRSRIPVLPGFQQRPAVSASTVTLRGLGSAQPKPSQPLQPLNPSEVDFNQSANSSTSNNDSGDDSSGLDSPIATRIKENCIRKSIGFGMRNRLIEKAKQLNIQRKQATVLLTTRTVEEVPLIEPPQATEGLLFLII